MLSKFRDPYTEWGTTQERRAQWVAALFAKWYSDRKTHLRGFHYLLISQPEPKNAEGELYENTESAWNYLLSSVLWARYMGIGDWSNLIDKKHPDPIDYADDVPESEAGELHPSTLTAEQIVDDVIEKIVDSAPRYQTGGYQRYTLIIFCEKNSMNDILEPICREVRAILQPLVGEASLEKVTALVRTARYLEKPIRVFYISDFDPSGKQMPVSVARKFEFYCREQGLDCKLSPIALTYEQVLKYRLPGIPTKTTDTRRAGFINAYGDRATELDALDALHPGELEKIVREALEPYVDADSIHTIRGENTRLRDMAQEIADNIKPAIMNALKIPGLENLDLNSLVNRDFTSPPSDHVADESDIYWLLDTDREYSDQIEEYRKFKEGTQNE